jgi:hypothetical protein
MKKVVKFNTKMFTVLTLQQLGVQRGIRRYISTTGAWKGLGGEGGLSKRHDPPHSPTYPFSSLCD